jgi:hypothetical protein
MIKKILKIIKEEFLTGFKWGFKTTQPRRKNKKFEIVDSHKKLSEDVYSASCMTLTEAGKMMPAFFLVRDDQYMPVMVDPSAVEEAGIQGYAQAVIQIADQQNADAIIFVSENWTIQRKLDDEELKAFENGKLLPSLDPDRQEMLTLVYFTKDGNMKVLSGEINRQIDNTPFVREWEWSDPESMSASFFGTWGR